MCEAKACWTSFNTENPWHEVLEGTLQVHGRFHQPQGSSLSPSQQPPALASLQNFECGEGIQFLSHPFRKNQIDIWKYDLLWLGKKKLTCKQGSFRVLCHGSRCWTSVTKTAQSITIYHISNDQAVKAPSQYVRSYVLNERSMNTKPLSFRRSNRGSHNCEWLFGPTPKNCL